MWNNLHYGVNYNTDYAHHLCFEFDLFTHLKKSTSENGYYNGVNI